MYKNEDYSDSDSEDNMSQVFISYKRDATGRIRALYDKLTSLGYKCWLDEHSLAGGDPINAGIGKGLRDCTVFIACLTDEYARARYCREEATYAGTHEKRIIPLILERGITYPPVGMELIFNDTLYIDFSQGSNDDEHFWDDDKKFLELIRALNKILLEHGNVGLAPPPNQKQNAGGKAATSGSGPAAAATPAQSGIDTMSDEHKELLIITRKKLVENIDLDSILNILISSKVLIPQDSSKIRSKPTRESKVEELLDSIGRKRDSAFYGLIDALKEADQHHLAKLLTG